jgi:hypothetical protein
MDVCIMMGLCGNEIWLGLSAWRGCFVCIRQHFDCGMHQQKVKRALQFFKESISIHSILTYIDIVFPMHSSLPNEALTNKGCDIPCKDLSPD